MSPLPHAWRVREVRRRGGLHSVATAAVLGVLLVAEPPAAQGQGELVGRVYSDSGRQPLAGAEVSMPRLGLLAASDTIGRFRLSGVPSGEHQLIVRALGFRPDTSTIESDGDGVSVKDFVLRPQITELPGRRITAAEVPIVRGKMAGFREREKVGIGHFVNREALAKEEGRTRTGDMLARIPGVSVKRGQSRAWIATGRAVTLGRCAFCPPAGLSKADRAAGAVPACYLDVYLDGILVFTPSQQEGGLFDVNSLELSSIEGIEVYTSAAQIPVQYNRTSSGCGVLVIWTRVG